MLPLAGRLHQGFLFPSPHPMTPTWPLSAPCQGCSLAFSGALKRNRCSCLQLHCTESCLPSYEKYWLSAYYIKHLTKPLKSVLHFHFYPPLGDHTVIFTLLNLTVMYAPTFLKSSCFRKQGLLMFQLFIFVLLSVYKIQDPVQEQAWEMTVSLHRYMLRHGALVVGRREMSVHDSAPTKCWVPHVLNYTYLHSLEAESRFTFL